MTPNESQLRGGAEGSIRDEVRRVVESSGIRWRRRCDAWMRGHDPEFSRLLGRHRLIGITWPKELGGRAAGNVERLIVTEELLRVGAPVAAHWIADRQIGPAILRHGSPALQREFLPGIARGDVTFCLGMSETEAGSDLAALRTKAVVDGDGFRITGRKIWTSHAHRSSHAYVLARTGGGRARHDGLTEFVVDLSSEGVTVRPIHDLSGEHHFNEVVFEDVVVPACQVIGQVDAGWGQVTEQLAFERGGMERVLSTYPLLAERIGAGNSPLGTGAGEADVEALGVLVARLHTLRAMALDVAEAMDAGEAPTRKAATLKYLGTTFEGDVVEHARNVVGISPDPDATGVEGLLADAIFASPGATLRGGASEVLLTILSRQEPAGPTPRRRGDDDDLRSSMDTVLGSRDRTVVGPHVKELWKVALDLGWTGVGVSDAAGGSGGGIQDLAVVARALARHARSAPIVESAVAGSILSERGTVDVSVPRTLGLGAGLELVRQNGSVVLNGTLTKLPWARFAESAVVAAAAPDGRVVVELPLDSDGLSLVDGTNMAGEPRDTVRFTNVRLPESAVLGDHVALERLRAVAVTLQSASIVGSLEAATALARDHVLTREQFGKPLVAFQAVAHTLARMAAEVASAEAGLAQAVAEVEAGGQGWRVLVGRLVASRAASAVAKSAHQLLGAMGITREHDLHLATRRLWAWRDELVPERVLARRLGQEAIVAGEDATWRWCVLETDRLSRDDTSPWKDL